jgi:lysophospholipase L1-like esterase
VQSRRNVVNHRRARAIAVAAVACSVIFPTVVAGASAIRSAAVSSGAEVAPVAFAVRGAAVQVTPTLPPPSSVPTGVTTVPPTSVPAGRGDRRCGVRDVDMVGDSLTVGTIVFGRLLSAFDSAGYTLWTDAKVGRFVATGRQILGAEAQAGRLAPIVVVALGTNDAAAGYSLSAFTREVDAVMGAVGPARTVVWVNLYLPAQDLHVGHNQVLEAKAVEYPNLVVADWAATGNDAHLERDQIHLNATGYRNRTAFVLAAVDQVSCRSGN